MPRNKIPILFFLLLSAGCLAQSGNGRQLSGTVVGKGEPVVDVHVMNTTTRRATITNAVGRFAIDVRLNDTLLFSAVQFKKRSLVISEDILESGEITVPLEEFVNELDEVVLRPFDLSGDLTNDMKNLKTGPVVTASTLGLPNAYVKPATQEERKLHEATTGGGLVPLNPVLNAISGRTKYLKKVLARERKYARTGRVRAFYADSLFVQELKIPEARIDDFMYYCEVDFAFSAVVDTHDRLRIWEFLKAKSNSYRKFNQLD